MKIIKKTVEQKVKKYIANDGTIFDSEVDCKNHEQKDKWDKLCQEVEKMEIKELRNNIVPITEDYISEDKEYRWYNINSYEDLKKLSELYNEDFGNYTLTYPIIGCVESMVFGNFAHDNVHNSYITYLPDIISIINEFLTTFGYRTTVKLNETEEVK